MKKHAISSLIGLSLALVGGALYQASPAYADAAQVQQQGDISYVMGGVGLGEREALTQQASRFNLKIVNTAPGGAYTADTRISIKDSDGREMLNTSLDGPWLLAKLPPGRYTVSANDGQRTQTRKLKLAASGMHRLQFTWNDAGEGGQGAIGNRPPR